MYSDKSGLPFVLAPTPARQESSLFSLKRARISLTVYKLPWDIWEKRYMLQLQNIAFVVKVIAAGLFNFYWLFCFILHSRISHQLIWWLWYSWLLSVSLQPKTPSSKSFQQTGSVLFWEDTYLIHIWSWYQASWLLRGKESEKHWNEFKCVLVKLTCFAK